MRWRPVTWLWLAAMCFLALLVVQCIGLRQKAKQPAGVQKNQPPGTPDSKDVALAKPAALQAKREQLSAVLPLTNTATSPRKLIRSGKAILLENAWYDTTQPISGLIPEHLRAKGDSGAYLVQSRAPPDDSFRRLLRAAGAEISSYIPNNAYLVRASAAVAQQIAADPQVQAVLPYEPYYKLQSPLLGIAVSQEPLPDNSALNVLLFQAARSDAIEEIKKLGLEILAEESSPFVEERYFSALGIKMSELF